MLGKMQSNFQRLERVRQYIHIVCSSLEYQIQLGAHRLKKQSVTQQRALNMLAFFTKLAAYCTHDEAFQTVDAKLIAVDTAVSNSERIRKSLSQCFFAVKGHQTAYVALQQRMYVMRVFSLLISSM
jgi:hypothetical protein